MSICGIAVRIRYDNLGLDNTLQGIESSSHKYGLVADTVQAYEILTADGDVVRATPEENTDLFYAIPWSYGAHGFLMAVELDIIPCEPYVLQQYVPVNSRQEMIELFQKVNACSHQPAFYRFGR